jgi:hypothetical protein
MPAKKPARPFFVDADARQHMIAVEAYILAERRGFAPGGEVEDWVTAERIVDQRLTSAAVTDKLERPKAKKKAADDVKLASPQRAKSPSKAKTKQVAAESVRPEGVRKTTSKP